jgi:hypothetical protein
MTVTKDDLVRAIHNLNNLTREGRMRWLECDPPSSISGPNALTAGFGPGIQTAFCAQYQEKTLRIIERASGPLSSLLGTPRYYTLEIVDNDGAVLYKFPDVQGIADLYESVKFKINDVEDIIKSLAHQR